MADQSKQRITKEQALSFLLTHIIVEQNRKLELDQLALFKLSNLAMEAVDQISGKEGIIPHEVIEALASEFFQ